MTLPYGSKRTGPRQVSKVPERTAFMKACLSSILPPIFQGLLGRPVALATLGGFIEWRYVTLFFIILLAAAGAYAFIMLGRAEDPSFTIKTLTVTTVWPG